MEVIQLTNDVFSFKVPRQLNSVGQQGLAILLMLT